MILTNHSYSMIIICLQFQVLQFNTNNLQAIIWFHETNNNNNNTNKWYMYDRESVQENEIHKLLWGFEIQTDHLISTRQPDLVMVNKKKKKWTCQIVDFVTLADHRVKL